LERTIPRGDARLAAWDAWQPPEVAQLLGGVQVPWWVAAGWALDLWRGVQTRPHKDLEICVPRTEWHEVRERLSGHDLWYVDAGGLQALHPGAEVPNTARQVWIREKVTGRWRLDVMLDPGSRAEWVCHRDPHLRRPLDAAVSMTMDGIPYLQPEIVLLLKAKYLRPKDEVDFAATLPLLNAARRRWLADALARLHPDHAWLKQVQATHRVDSSVKP
jgi:hypothetical protein